MFVFVITVANNTLLTSFFTLKQKKLLISQTERLSKIDINNQVQVSNVLSEISDTYKFDVEIYTQNGNILYTTHGSQMMDFFIVGQKDFSMSHEILIPNKTENLKDGITFQQSTRKFDNSEFLLCRKQIENGIFAEIRVQKELITSSSATASEFITIVALICFLISIVWIIVFARKFSKPLSQMNEITKDMAELKFERKLDIKSKDEIGQLALSINEMSNSLSSSLEELKTANGKLRDEIQLERELDTMRKGFVANVSHELKTPISIISGYAQGLKLNVNTQSKEEYCDVIIDESERMNELVLSILELSKYESGQIPLNKETFDIGVLTEQMLKRMGANGNIAVSNEIPQNTVIYADKSQTEQVLKVYLENAFSHTDDGGKITVNTQNIKDKLRICVFNTGKQIEEEKMPQIWQSFYRGDTSHKRDNTRFGLGLSIVNAIMKMHNCDCGVYNTADGVCFWFEANQTV